MSKLPLKFYLRDDVVEIAKDLLGKMLITNIDGKVTSGRIVETEAYNGRTDKASHAYRGLRSARTEVMYQQGGRSYVYLCYGIHHLFNVVTNTEGKADAVLIRALEPVQGIEFMMERRNSKQYNPLLTSGPGKLAQAMGIKTSMSNESLLDTKIWIENHSERSQKPEIISSMRVGVEYAEECAQFPWRFYYKGNAYVSK